MVCGVGSQCIHLTTKHPDLNLLSSKTKMGLDVGPQGTVVGQRLRGPCHWAGAVLGAPHLEGPPLWRHPRLPSQRGHSGDHLQSSESTQVLYGLHIEQCCDN